MKKVVTIVGKSILDSYFSYDSSRNEERIFKSLRAADMNTSRDVHNQELTNQKWVESKLDEHLDDNKFEDYDRLNTKIVSSLNRLKINSAEIQSIIAIQKELKEEIEVELIATDSLLSRMSAELIKKWFDTVKKDANIKINFTPQNQVIKDLQLVRYDLFIQVGFRELVNYILKLKETTHQDNIIFNLTGGYKAITSLLTTVAQVEGIVCYYLFEEEWDNDVDKGKYRLVKLPKIPLKMDTQIFEKYTLQFHKVEECLPKEAFAEDRDFLEEADHLLYKEDGFIGINQYAYTLWRRFRQQLFTYYTVPEVQGTIEKNEAINEIFKNIFYSKELRKVHTIAEDTHKMVFKKSTTENRIYYFYDSNKIFIYRIFSTGEHAHHVKSIREEPFSQALKEEIIAKSSVYFINTGKTAH